MLIVRLLEFFGFAKSIYVSDSQKDHFWQGYYRQQHFPFLSAASIPLP